MYFHVELFFLGLTLSVANALNFAEDNISKSIEFTFEVYKEPEEGLSLVFVDETTEC
jgi:hypothetical protein